MSDGAATVEITVKPSLKNKNGTTIWPSYNNLGHKPKIREERRSSKEKGWRGQENKVQGEHTGGKGYTEERSGSKGYTVCDGQLPN